MSQEGKIAKVVVGVIIFKDDKVLIGKRRRKHGDGEYSFPGGALEYGEYFEDCVRREVLEEAGIKIKNINFLSIANSTKLFGIHEVQVHFRADWESGEARDLPEERIGSWQWYDLDKIPEPFFFPAQITFDSYKTGKNYFDLK
jgi:8-oxo-dGTP diphosphatase